MPSVYARCPTCNENIPGPTQGQANRNLGLHRRAKHGYRSPEYEEAKQYRLNAKRKVMQAGAAVVELEAKARAIKGGPMTNDRREQLRLAREARWGRYPLSTTPAALEKRKQTYTPEQKLKRKQYQENYRLKRKAAMDALAKNNTPSEAKPCKLDKCPVCNARFFVCTD